MKKILILSNSASGLYEFRNEIILDMMRDSKVYVSIPDEDKYCTLLEEEGCHIIYTPFERRGMNPAKDIGLYRQYKTIIKRVRPDLVCTYTIKPNIYGGIACRMTKTAYAINITGLGTAIQGGGLLSMILIMMYKLATARAETVFFQNEYNRSFMNSRGIAMNNSELLPGSGVNLEIHSYKPYPTEDSGINILSVMRVMKDKGVEELFKAIESLGSANCHFFLAGSYEEESRMQYETIITRLVSESKLSYLGFVDDMDSLYEKCHMVVHPSYHEGLSNVCLEAAANGRMVLASRIPGCQETIDDGKSGYLFEAKSTESLVQTIMTALELSSADREAMGAHGREYISERYNRKIVISKYRELLERI